MATGLISRFVCNLSLLFHPLVSIQGMITKQCQPFCMKSTSSDITTSCAVHPGCDVIFPLCSFTCAGPEYCDIIVHLDFVNLDGTNWSYDFGATIIFAEKSNFSISENSVFKFAGVSYQGTTNHDIRFNFYLSVENIHFTDYGNYNISFYDYFYPRVVFEHTYWLLKLGVTPTCNTDLIVTPFSQSVSAFLLTCSIEDFYHPMDININPKENCSFKEAHPVGKNKIVKLVILKSYYEELEEEQFRCVSTSRIIPTTFPTQNCTFNFNYNAINSQARPEYFSTLLAVLTILVGIAISTLLIIVRRKRQRVLHCGGLLKCEIRDRREHDCAPYNSELGNENRVDDRDEGNRETLSSMTDDNGYLVIINEDNVGSTGPLEIEHNNKEKENLSLPYDFVYSSISKT